MTASQVKDHFSRRNLKKVEYIRDFGETRIFFAKNKTSSYYISVDLRGETDPYIMKIF